MTVTATYDSTLSRVRVSATGLGTSTVATLERSTDQLRWTTVRGGVDVPVTAGNTATVDDYEFSPDVANYYRWTYPAPMSFVAAGAAAHGNNASVVPGLPAGWAQGDVLLVLAAIRNSGVGVPSTPAGYTLLVDGSNMRLFGKVAGSSESAPTVAFTGGVANADTSAQMAALRGVDMASIQLATQLYGSAQDMSTPGITVAEPIAVATLLYVAWKQDDLTSVVPVTPNITQIDAPSTTTGDDQSMAWWYRIYVPTVPFTSLTSRTYTVTGGAAAINRGAVAVFESSAATQIGSVTPALGSVWIKNLSRPFLNRPVTVTDWGDVEREARNGVFPIVGRTMPVAVTDLRLSRSYELVLTTATVDEAEELDLCLASGEPILVHVPADCDVPGMYAVVGNVAVSRREARSARRYLTLPLTEVAAPGPDVVGATNTWASVIATYATWADLIAANPTWQDLLDGVADPGDVVVD